MITRSRLLNAQRIDGSSVERLAWWLGIDECNPQRIIDALVEHFEMIEISNEPPTDL